MYKQYDQISLVDDDGQSGGFANQGETLADFLETMNTNQPVQTIKDVNQVLKKCGIQPIDVLPESHELVAFGVWDKALKGYKPCFANLSVQQLIEELKE